MFLVALGKLARRLELLPGWMVNCILSDEGNDGFGVGTFRLDMDYEGVVRRWWMSGVDLDLEGVDPELRE